MRRASQVKLVAWYDFLCRDCSTNDSSALEDGNAVTCLCQIGRCDESVMAGADDGDIVIGLLRLRSSG